jgi:DNA mismatch repair protein MSH6
MSGNLGKRTETGFPTATPSPKRPGPCSPRLFKPEPEDPGDIKLTPAQLAKIEENRRRAEAIRAAKRGNSSQSSQISSSQSSQNYGSQPFQSKTQIKYSPTKTQAQGNSLPKPQFPSQPQSRTPSPSFKNNISPKRTTYTQLTIHDAFSKLIKQPEQSDHPILEKLDLPLSPKSPKSPTSPTETSPYIPPRAPQSISPSKQQNQFQNSLPDSEDMEFLEDYFSAFDSDQSEQQEFDSPQASNLFETHSPKTNIAPITGIGMGMGTCQNLAGSSSDRMTKNSIIPKAATNKPPSQTKPPLPPPVKSVTPKSRGRPPKDSAPVKSGNQVKSGLSEPKLNTEPVGTRKAGWKPMAINQKHTELLDEDLQNKGAPSKSYNTKEERWFWLAEPLDSLQRPQDHPDYDPSTLYIPEKEFRKLTSTRQQYWNFKRNHFDTILFFQVGSFYELYEQDAYLGARIMDLKLTARAPNMHSVGVPLSAYQIWASKFVALGYKVARMDQVTREDLAPTENMHRRVGDMLSIGTLVDSPLLGDQSNYLFSLFENRETNEFGICFVDCSMAKFFIGWFIDDKFRTYLKTVLLQTKPKEFLYLKGHISRETLFLVKKLVDPMISSSDKTQCWNASYLENKLQEKFSSVLDHPVIQHYARTSECALSAFSGCLEYLHELQNLDEMLLEQNNINPYHVFQQDTSLVLDGQTLINLEILENSYDHSTKDTLLSTMMHCFTGFGKRLFTQWICHPLRNISKIEERLNAVEELMQLPDLVQFCQETFSKLPDLDRLLSRLHTKNISLKNVLLLLEGMEELIIFVESYGLKVSTDNSGTPYKFRTPVLANLVTSVNNGGDFPEIQDRVLFFSNSVIKEASRDSNRFVAGLGFDPDYDQAFSNYEELQHRLEEHLEELKAASGVDQIKYVSNTSGKYQIEIPKKFLNAPGLENLVVMKKLQNCTRFYDPAVGDIIVSIDEAKSQLDLIADGLFVKFIELLDEEFANFKKAVECIAQVDCLLSLAKVSSSSGMHSMCRPKFHEPTNGSFVDIRDLIHPYLRVSVDAELIPNDIIMGGEHPRGILLTGPNMGGKSTLLRQACLAIIMAQLGSYVPASSCELTPVDRIFTRIGANDNIFEGESTFMVELQETSTILHTATKNSFVILDELGRGTSTFDGSAIAHSVLYHLLHSCKSLVMFATHYHMLVDDWKNDPIVGLFYMYSIEDEQKKTITFLYKAIEGICPSSHGMNVARMAQIPETIVRNAEIAASSFEKTFKQTYQRRKGTLDLTAFTTFYFFHSLSFFSGTTLPDGLLAELENSLATKTISPGLLHLWQSMNKMKED